MQMAIPLCHSLLKAWKTGKGLSLGDMVSLSFSGAKAVFLSSYLKQEP